MAAAVQTNLSVAFTHGVQLTMDHCGALIHGAAILWSRLLSQPPQETLLLCRALPASNSTLNEAGDHLLALRGDVTASLFGTSLPDAKEPGFYLSLCT